MKVKNIITDMEDIKSSIDDIMVQIEGAETLIESARYNLGELWALLEINISKLKD